MKIMIISLMLTTMLTLGACMTQSAGVSLNSMGSVRIDDSLFASTVAVEQAHTRRVGGMMQGSVLLVNQALDDINVQYKFTWYDENGRTIDDEGVSWKALKLRSQQRLQVASMAPNPQAINFEIYVREAVSH